MTSKAAVLSAVCGNEVEGGGGRDGGIGTAAITDMTSFLLFHGFLFVFCLLAGQSV